MPPFGPLYCETPPSILGAFPLEPWNAISSGVIVLFGLAALWIVRRRAPADLLLYAMTALLVVNGVGSILWHGLRTRWALNLDVIPALVFLVLMAIIWAKRVSPWWQTVALVAFVLAAPLTFRFVAMDLSFYTRMGVSAAALTLAALWLIWRASVISAPAAALGAASLGAAVVALGFRTLDPIACPDVPFGTHFLWHVFLSSAAFLGLLTLIALKDAATRRAAA